MTESIIYVRDNCKNNSAKIIQSRKNTRSSLFVQIFARNGLEIEEEFNAESRVHPIRSRLTET